MKLSLKPLLSALLIMLLNGCRLDPYVVVDSVNQNSRINYLVIHATSENFAESLRLLTTPSDNPVSSHYLVPAEHDASYTDKALKVYSLVPEQRRAWHAGLSNWGRETGLNDRSIGIEVVNEFKCEGTEGVLEETQLGDIHCVFPAYTPKQIESLTKLISGILERYPQIEPINIVGHSDIALLRKSDPGPSFPWHDLYLQGIGAWPDSSDVEYFWSQSISSKPSVEAVQKALAILGYGIEVSGTLDPATEFAVRALQLHFRPANYSGELDHETVAILWALIKKYRQREFQERRSELVFG
jgi:N-acetylmuramoyl-L-alanine amidase